VNEQTLSTTEDELGLLHAALVRGILERGHCPANAELAQSLGLNEPALRQRLRALAEIHGVVLHPHDDRPWLVHPFSLTPTLNYVEAEGGSWWAPCLWCAFGIAALVGGAARIHTRLGAEAEPVVIQTSNGVPVSQRDLVVHFAVPPARAWQNVHEHCALVLPFRSERAISEWCVARGIAMGEAVPLEQVSLLALAWYGDHASPQWRKWSVAEAQQLFRGAGLTSSFWDLPAGEGRF